MPQEAATFRAFYLDGETKPTARQVGRSLCMDKTSVFRHNRRVLKAMLPAVFGLDGLFQSAEESLTPCGKALSMCKIFIGK